MYNIIVFANLFKPHLGGMQKYIETFYTNIPKKKILIITSRYQQSLKEQENFKNLHILRINSIKIINDKYYIPSLKGLGKIIQIFRENYNNNPEIHTHTRFYFINVIATYFAKKYNLKHYHFEHGSSFVKDGSFIIRTFAYIFDRTLARYTLKNAELVFPISLSVKAFLEENFKNIKYGPVIYNSYDFKSVEIQNKKKPKLLKLLFVGRIIKSKGIYELIDACKLLSKENFAYSLTIIGDGSERIRLQNYVRRNGLENNVTIKGPLPFEQTQEEYKNHDMLINPSYTEGLPTTVLEALANGLLIIATDVGGTKEIINQEDLIKLEDLSGKTLYTNIKKLYDNWEKEYTKLIKEYSFAKNKFNWGKNIKKYYSAVNHT